MNESSQSGSDSDLSKIAAVREAWLAGVKAADADGLAGLVTDDIVVVHGNGRCVRGKEEVRADFLEGFQRFAIEQSVSSAEVALRGKWAIEIGDVESVLRPVLGGQEIRAHSRTVVVLACQPDASWKVCRVLGLPD